MGPSTTGPQRPALICRKQMRKPRALMPMRVSPAAKRSSANKTGRRSLTRIAAPYHLSPPGNKVRAAAPVHPNTPIIEAPCLALDTGGAAPLVRELYTAAGIRRTVIALSIIRRAGDGCPVRTTGSARTSRSAGSPATPKVKVRPAPAVHPDPLAAITPGLPLDTR